MQTISIDHYYMGNISLCLREEASSSLAWSATFGSLVKRNYYACLRNTNRKFDSFMAHEFQNVPIVNGNEHDGLRNHKGKLDSF
jgi:hypothetical protein